jgi:hypothetical protein
MAFQTVQANEGKLYQAYRLLDVGPGDSTDTIKMKYLNLVKTYHPDKLYANPTAQAEATEKMKEINESYCLIKNAPLSAAEGSPEPEPPKKTKSKFSLCETCVYFFYGVIIGTGLSIMLLLCGIALYKILIRDPEKLQTIITNIYILVGFIILVCGILSGIFKKRFFHLLGKPFIKRYSRA